MMPQGGVTIRVYSQNRLVKTYHVPVNGRGTRWNVFRIVNGVIIDDNAVVAR